MKPSLLSLLALSVCFLIGACHSGPSSFQKPAAAKGGDAWLGTYRHVQTPQAGAEVINELPRGDSLTLVFISDGEQTCREKPWRAEIIGQVEQNEEGRYLKDGPALFYNVSDLTVPPAKGGESRYLLRWQFPRAVCNVKIRLTSPLGKTFLSDILIKPVGLMMELIDRMRYSKHVTFREYEEAFILDPRADQSLHPRAKFQYFIGEDPPKARPSQIVVDGTVGAPRDELRFYLLDGETFTSLNREPKPTAFRSKDERESGAYRPCHWRLDIPEQVEDSAYLCVHRLFAAGIACFSIEQIRKKGVVVKDKDFVTLSKGWLADWRMTQK